MTPRFSERDDSRQIGTTAAAPRLFHAREPRVLPYWRQDHPDPHDDLVGHGLWVGPVGVADPVIEPLDRARALGDAVARRVLGQRDRHDGVAGDALQAQL